MFRFLDPFLIRNFTCKFLKLPVLRAMEKPEDYDITKDIGDEDVDETKIGRI